MQTLAYGSKLPESGDSGEVFFPALEDNITQMDAHSHNGVNSAKLTSASVTVHTQALLAADWTEVGSGLSVYRQLVTLPGTMQYDQYAVSAKLASGNLFYPTIEKVSGTTFYIYVNDNTLAPTICYGS
jgi:hypothetical protein